MNKVNATALYYDHKVDSGRSMPLEIIRNHHNNTDFMVDLDLEKLPNEGRVTIAVHCELDNGTKKEATDGDGPCIGKGIS